MTINELLNLETQITIVHPLYGKCRIMGICSTIDDVITSVTLSPDSNTSVWVQITDFQNLTQEIEVIK